MQQILKKTPCRIRTTGETQSYLCLSRFLIEKLHMILYFIATRIHKIPAAPGFFRMSQG